MMREEHEAITGLLGELLVEPSQERYEALRERYVRSSFYAPYGDHLSQLLKLVEQEEMQEALRYWHAHKMSMLLSPLAHIYAAQILEATGDEHGVRLERMLVRVMVQGLLRSGDGSEQRPYIVTATSDEYDVLGFLQRRRTLQRLIRRDGKCYDVLRLEDGAELWFDVTTPMEHLDRTLSPTK